MVSTRRRRQSNRSHISQLDDFDQDIIIGNIVSQMQESATVNEGTGDQDFTVGTSGNNLMCNGITVNVKTLERCQNQRIDREMGNIVETVENRLQIATSMAIDNIIGPKIELVLRSKNCFFWTGYGQHKKKIRT